MLDFVAQTLAGLRPDPQGARGVLYKAPKPGQDLRVDLPALGPETVAQAARAGLGGIVWQAGAVLLLDRAEMVAAAEKAGLFLWSRAP
jgi:UDP-2,3-diacylglucosamine hydrolase